MATAELVPSTLTGASATNSRQNHRWRGQRRGNKRRQPNEENPLPGNGDQNGARNASLALRPTSIGPIPQPSSTEPSSTENSAAENGPPSRARSYRRGGARGSRNETQTETQDRMQASSTGGYENSYSLHPTHGRVLHGSGRQFGGRLTSTIEENRPLQSSNLSADAPEFKPGQIHQHRSAGNRKGRGGTNTAKAPITQVPRMRRGSSLKSTAPDLATRIHEDIANCVYECAICTSEITQNSKIWSCRTCWTVFHLTCIKKWAENEGSTHSQQRNQDGEFSQPRQWRCPGCNLPKDVLPSTYACWCEKEVDPRPISGLPPHSCGQTCGKHRLGSKQCPHPCELLCHAGPCPPCTHMGPTQSCFCGKKATTRKCVDTNYDTGWSCEQICGDLMPCGEHTCPRPCHEGLCGACDVRIDALCYCGKVQKSMPCSERGSELESKKTSFREGGKVTESWTGIFGCNEICHRHFDCGKHACQLTCHPQEAEPAHCPLSPDQVSTCSCGKTPLMELLDESRKTCEDPIPNCGKMCLRWLPCGHLCQQVCHSGACLACLQTVKITCQCGRTTSSTICHQGREERPQCMRVCKVTLNCGRHECGERCCTGEKKATERQAIKRKLRPLGVNPRTLDEGIEPEHICTRLCGRLLKCGNHTCPELCHKGPCRSCREAIFDEISCHCGRTVLQPPLPCGTSLPPCRYECERPKNCGHPQVPHNCHSDQETCPKCPFLTEKPCMCSKKTLKNQPCWLVDVRCGEICGRKLKCGSHFCRKQCHRPEECEDTGLSCQQQCGKAKKTCGHPCEEQCHAPSSCKEDRPCQNKMIITCDCQHLKQEVKCSASRSSYGNCKKILSCDDECARLERNRKLALALNIDPQAHKDDHIPYSIATLHLYQENPKWAQTQEREMRAFAADQSEKRLRFKPMPPHQRQFIHSLAEDFGFDSEGVDPEPYRHVFVFKTPKFVMAPMKTLSECVRIKNAAAIEGASLSLAEDQRRKQLSNEPYNGFLLTGPRFALTLDELRADCSSVLDTASNITFAISFLPSEEIVLKAHPASPLARISANFIEESLKALKTPFTSIIASKQIATSVHLCTLDPSLNILRRENDSTNNTGGWSQVAAKAASGPRPAPSRPAIGDKSSFTVLGSKLKYAKRKKETAKEKAEIVDDWEEEVRKEEEAATKHDQEVTESKEAVEVINGAMQSELE